MRRSRTLGGVNVKAKRSNNERDLKKRENLEAKKRKREGERRSEESAESKSDMYGENYTV